MSSQDITLIRYEPAGAFVPGRGVTVGSLELLAGALEAARAEVLEDLSLLNHDGLSQDGINEGAKIPDHKVPLDAGFIEMPQRLLSEYRQQPSSSELGRMLATASRLRDSVDRVVLLGIGGSYMGARALMGACCDPYHNELSRVERGSWPRLYFEGNNLDNDATQALLGRLGAGGAATSVDDRWALLVISKSGGTIETAVSFRQFLATLRTSCAGDDEAVAELVVPVTGKKGRLFDRVQALGCPEIYRVPDRVGGRFSVLSPVGLLPAAVLGLDIVKLLEGAAAMNEHFFSAPPGKNLVLDYVGIGHLWEAQQATIRVLSVWSQGLEAVGLWYDQLLAESLGKAELGATPLTAVNTRDLHSRGQQHQEGRRDKLITNLILEGWRSDSLQIDKSASDEDGLNELAGTTIPELMTAAIEGTNLAYEQDGRPTADLFLPRSDESSLGQLFQMLMLATVVEGRLLGVNPYGQSGVEAYKGNMAQKLGRAK